MKNFDGIVIAVFGIIFSFILIVGVFAFFVTINNIPNQDASHVAIWSAINNTTSTGNQVFNIVGVVLVVGAFIIYGVLAILIYKAAKKRGKNCLLYGLIAIFIPFGWIVCVIMLILANASDDVINQTPKKYVESVSSDKLIWHRCNICGNTFKIDVKKEINQCPYCSAIVSVNAAKQVKESRHMLYNKEKKNIEESFFSYKGRITRLNYFTIVLFITFLDFLVMFMIPNFSSGLVSIVLAVFLLDPILHSFAAVKRFHDTNLSGWYLLLYLVPIANLWIRLFLLFTDGTKGSNKYGEDPKNRLPEVNYFNQSEQYNKCCVCGKSHRKIMIFLFRGKEIKIEHPTFCSKECIEQIGVNCKLIIPQFANKRDDSYLDYLINIYGDWRARSQGYRKYTINKKTGRCWNIYYYQVWDDNKSIKNLSTFIQKCEKSMG